MPDIERKQILTEQTERLNKIDELIPRFLERNIDNIHTPFTLLRKTISPFIDKLQVHLDIFPEKQKKMNVS